MTPEDLDLVPLNDLKAALLRRGDHALLAILWVGAAGAQVHETVTAWNGNPHMLAGLAADISKQIIAGLHVDSL
jgi:hypothetical protein